MDTGYRMIGQGPIRLERTSGPDPTINSVWKWTLTANGKTLVRAQSKKDILGFLLEESQKKNSKIRKEGKL